MPRYAYAFYATNDVYAVAVMVFVRLLRRLGVREDIDLVVLHAGVSPRLVARLREMGLRPREAAPPWRSEHRYYRDCFVKLRVFELAEYERIVYVDADAVPLAPLDHLFAMPLTGPLAAPRADWLPQPFWGTHMMVVAPSADAWRRIAAQLALAADNRHFDMDIVNVAFAGAIAALPDHLVRLNSEWEDTTRAGFDRHEARRANTAVVHFTALGKPWAYPLRRVRRLRPDAHPLFYDTWEMWRRTRDELFAGRPLDRLTWAASRLAPMHPW